ncbi:IS1 family transposase [Nostoc commune]|uniref:IS1 family transposase n=1 Tax=Nostoc commune TaxID=1178 RepID=UPI0018C47D99|nr:IS1 family transposase [Nostoc commune BAE]
MASRIFSIRLDDRVVEALEALQLPDDDSLNTTLKRFVIDSLGIDVNSSVHTVNNDERLQELIRQEVENALNTIASQERLQEAVHIIVNECIQNQNNILDDHEFRLGKLEELAQEVFSSTPQALSLPVSTKPTAIATKAANVRPTCPHCQSTISIGNGKDRHGLPRYKCKDCGKTFTWS